jgi:Uma2 family endonuclease
MGTRTLLSVEQFLELPDKPGVDYELIQGEVIEVPRPNPQVQRAHTRSLSLLDHFLSAHSLGVAVGEVEVQLDTSTVLIPDIAVWRTEQWRRVDKQSRPVKEIPALVVEVVSPSNTQSGILARAQEYLRAGVQAVLLVTVSPVRMVHVLERERNVRLLTEEDTLQVPDILPGFSVKVRDLCPD